MSNHRHPPHHPHRPARRAPHHISETLRALVRAGLAADLEAVIRMADEIDPTGSAGEYLRELGAERDVVLALRLLEAHLEGLAVMRHQQALDAVSSGKVAFVPPVPRYIFDDFGWSENAVALVLDRHELPPSVRHRRRMQVCSNFHEAIGWINKVDAIVFDASRVPGGFAARAIVVALLDERHLTPHVRLLVHERRHGETEDITVPDAVAVRFQLI